MYRASRLARVSLRGLTLDCNVDNLDYTRDYLNALRRLQESNLDHTFRKLFSPMLYLHIFV
ncbi:hypothetical protein BDV97DRAFT_343707 [Delphinella strobiligena]|nr:hypothetical protein BDV97DRAFT_343707 [Delphinella strobiligena]